MNKIKTNFSIKDLENLSGIKAHTLRIWERRYNLFQPERDENNIRTYNNENLQKLFNINLLLVNGYKISKVAALSEDELLKNVRQIAIEKPHKIAILDTLKLSMMTFDKALFNKTIHQLILEKSFKFVLYEVLYPFLHEIGLLWQTQTITPAHEHFISNMIRHKLLTQIEKLENTSATTDNLPIILFLPHLEIHEIGLLVVYYELLLLGKNVVYLGSSIPSENLSDFSKIYKDCTFVSYMTVYPEDEALPDFLEYFQTNILTKPGHQLLLTGVKSKKIKDLKNEQIHIYNTVTDMLDFFEKK